MIFRALIVGLIFWLARVQAAENILFAASLNGANIRCEIVTNGPLVTVFCPDGPSCIGGLVGSGTLVLSGNTLSYQIQISPGGIPIAAIHGPAGAEEIAPELFPLNPCLTQGTNLDCVTQGSLTISDAQRTELLSGQWYVSARIFSPMGPLVFCGIRGQILPVLPPDSDGDGVPDSVDACPNTPAGALVDANGCSIQQLAPCNGPWKNHGEYVKAVETAASGFLAQQLISRAEWAVIVKEAAKSDCAKALTGQGR